jgi:hypothetical protein
MPAPPISDEKLKETANLFEKNKGSTRKVAQELNISEGAVRIRIKNAKLRGIIKGEEEPEGKPPFWIDDLPDEDIPVEDLVKQGVERWERKERSHNARKLINVNLRKKLDGVFGLAIIGDPHLDDDGCNWRKITEDNKAMVDADMVAINIGDLTNNWIGRLMSKYADQETTRKQAIKLIEWYLTKTNVYWAGVIGGNHDFWGHEHGNVIDFIMKSQPGMFQNHGFRMNLMCPNGRQVRVNCRHDFAGNSQWNETHAISKAARFGTDDIYAAGHKHTSGYQIIKDPESSKISHAVRVAGYKEIDDFALQKGFREHKIWESMCFIIDPYQEDPLRFIKPVFSLTEAAEEIKWKRNRK